MARINKSSTALVNTIAGDLLVQSESTALFDLMNSLNVKIDSMSTMTDKMNALRAVSAVVASRRDEYEKTAPEYVRLNVLKVSVIDRLLEIFQEEYVALEKRLDFFNRKINGVKGLRFDVIQNRLYIPGCIPSGYEYNPGYGTEGNVFRILKKEPEASEFAQGLIALSQGEISEQYEFSKMFSDGLKRREAMKKIFHNPETLRFYAGYKKNDEAGLEFPIQGEHEPLMNLDTLRKLFVKLLPDGADKEKNLEYVDALLKQMSEDKITVEKPIVELEVVPEVVPEVESAPPKEGVQQNIFPKKDKEKKKKEKKLSRQDEAAEALTKKKEKFDALVSQARKLLTPIQEAIYRNKNVYTFSPQELSNLRAARKFFVDSLVYHHHSFYPVQDMIDEIDRLTRLSPEDIDPATGRPKNEIL